MAIHFARLSPFEQCFAWTYEDGSVIHIAVDRLRTYLAGTGFPVTHIALPRAFVEQIARQNGIDPAHLPRLEPDKLDEPIVIAQQDDGTQLVVDGAHRLIRRYQRNDDAAPVWDLPQRVWRRFLVEGMPGDDEAWGAFLHRSAKTGVGIANDLPPDRAGDVLIRCTGVAGAVQGDDDAANAIARQVYDRWLESFDHEAHGGRGAGTWTDDPARAMRFPDGSAALRFWRAVPKARPIREDGNPNRPLTAYTITFDKVADLTHGPAEASGSG